MSDEAEFDCVVIGAGFAGLVLARHILLRRPATRILLIDPRPPTRGDRDLKVGESTVEIGRQVDNLILDPDELHGVRNASSWLRVRHVDRSIFCDGFHPDRAATSFYYATNHFFGHGHWVWMIPSRREDTELSVGVVFHRDKIALGSLDSRPKLLSFLEANHRLVRRLIDSGELIDFGLRPQIAYRSKRMLSPDNWYVLGDAAYIIDAFYSLGTSTIAIAAESISEIIRGALDRDPEVEHKRGLYDDFNLAFADLINGLFRAHGDHLGHATLMSWRIYLEWMWWFGFMVPMFVGRWHLDPEFLSRITPMLREQNHTVFGELYAELSDVARSGAKIRLLDPTRTDSLAPAARRLGALARGYAPYHEWDAYRAETKFESRRVNVFKSLSRTSLMTLVWFAALRHEAGRPQWDARARGLSVALGKGAGRTALADVVFRARTRGMPSSSLVEARDRAALELAPIETLQPWLAGGTS
jgi:hypothetical protein